jgi:hypothetical protein
MARSEQITDDIDGDDGPTTKGAIGRFAGDQHYLHSVDRMYVAFALLRRLLAGAGLVIVGLGGVVGFLAWRNEKKETYTFVRNQFGEVVQADPTSFLHAGDDRTKGEVGYYIRELIEDGWSWTPLDVNDRLAAFEEKVALSARNSLREGLRLGERDAQAREGVSGRIVDEEGKAPQVLVLRQEASLFEVQATFERYLFDQRGVRSAAPTMVLRVVLRPVPRGPRNRYGLLVVEGRISQRL